jgi:hypothetical protein
MPIPLLTQGFSEGFSSIPHAYLVLKAAACLTVLALLKVYFGGARNHAERLMRSKVVMVTVSLHSGLSFDPLIEGLLLIWRSIIELVREARQGSVQRLSMNSPLVVRK